MFLCTSEDIEVIYCIRLQAQFKFQQMHEKFIMIGKLILFECFKTKGLIEI